MFHGKHLHVRLCTSFAPLLCNTFALEHFFLSLQISVDEQTLRRVQNRSAFIPYKRQGWSKTISTQTNDGYESAINYEIQ